MSVDGGPTRLVPPGELVIPRSSLEPGTQVDHFRILRLLGAGGMGEVYLARDTVLGRKVALKMVHPDHAHTQEFIERFIAEARATAAFNHPHIVTVHAVGSFEGSPYIALEYLEGETLSARLARERPTRREALR